MSVEKPLGRCCKDIIQYPRKGEHLAITMALLIDMSVHAMRSQFQNQELLIGVMFDTFYAVVRI